MFLILSLFVNFLLFSALAYIFRQNHLAHCRFENLQQQNSDLSSNVAVLQAKFDNKNNECQKYENILHETSHKKDELDKRNSELQAHQSDLEKNLEKSEKKFIDFEEKIQKTLDENKNFIRDNLNYESEVKFLKEKLENHKKEIEELHKISQQSFENIANKILQEKSEKFTEINKNNITSILEPLGHNINNFKKQVSDTYDKDLKQRVELQEQIKNLLDQTNKVSNEANNLATALKGNSKKQGNWGEMILETILQHSGLQKDIHYFKEKSFNNEEGQNLRPDFQIHLPDNRLIIADSKVSLVAYNKFCESKNDEESKRYIDEHLKSVYSHVDNLSSKNYDDLEKSLDFTMMFMPVEPAYILAIQADKDLWSYAYSKRILIMSPTNLIACLKIIDDLWKREMQSKNAMAIVNRGEKLYNKFVSFTESILEIGRKLNDSQKAFDGALNQMKEGKGNLLWQAESLRGLGLKSEKKIPIDFDILQEDE
jgi:DNA recombination protein RmuC